MNRLLDSLGFSHPYLLALVPLVVGAVVKNPVVMASMVASSDWTGRTTPLHCTASGKVMLAAMAERDKEMSAKETNEKPHKS